MKALRIFLILAVFLTVSLSNVFANVGPNLVDDDDISASAGVIHNDLLILPEEGNPLGPVEVERGQTYYPPSVGSSVQPGQIPPMVAPFTLYGTASASVHIVVDGMLEDNGVKFFAEWGIYRTNPYAIMTLSSPTGTSSGDISFGPYLQTTGIPAGYPPCATLFADMKISKIEVSPTASLTTHTVTFNITASYN